MNEPPIPNPQQSPPTAQKPIRVRFIDPMFSTRNPSTNGLVCVAGALASKEGWEVEIWSRDLDPVLENLVSHRKLPGHRFPGPLQIFADFCIFHYWAVKDLFSKSAQPHKTVATGFYFLPASYSNVQFSHFDWLKHQIRLGIFNSAYSMREILKTLPGIITELLLFYNPWKNTLLPASHGVAQDLDRWAGSWKKVIVLPNAIHRNLFSPERRDEFRKEARKRHGFQPDEVVLAFACNGHFYRKGLILAVEVIYLLRQKGHQVRMLLIGGREVTLNREKIRLRKAFGELDWITYTGMVADPSFHFSAADGFLFPSLSEAFSLVEIEAAAHGLPLFLTPHHGSEMILRDGINGRLLPWDVPGMVKIMDEEIRKGIKPLMESDTGRALPMSEYVACWKQLLSS